MKGLITVKSLILVFTLLLGIIPVTATERPFAANGNGVAAFITDGGGNVVGANLTLSGNGTHLGLFTGTGTIQFLPDANDPNIVHPSGGITYVASNGDQLPTVIQNGSMDLRTGIATGYMVSTRHWPFRRSKWENCKRSRAELRHGRLHIHHGWNHRLLIQPDQHTGFSKGARGNAGP